MPRRKRRRTSVFSFKRDTIAKGPNRHRSLLIEELEDRRLLAARPVLFDINATPPLAELHDLVDVDGVLFFTADDVATGRELWKLDETGVTRVKDVRPGPHSSFPTDLINVDGTLFFTADDGVHGRELWKSDGTEDGTALIRDIGHEEEDPFLFGGNFTDVAGTLFFIANDGIHGYELWKSDGTEDGTQLVKDIAEGFSAFTGSNTLTDVNGTLFFTANDGVHGRELWKSNGTEDGTHLVKDIWQGGGSSFLSFDDFAEVNGTLFFKADDGTHGRELWKSDGTEGGTQLVKDIREGPFGPFGNSQNLTDVDGTLFFTADDGEHGFELWRSDGTEGGTQLVKDIWEGPSSSSGPSVLNGQLTNVNGTLFFTADDGTHGSELWKSDGTEGGTELVKDIFEEPSSYAPGGLTNLNGALFFTADDGEHGFELWKSDGTEDGTQLVKDIFEGPNSSFARQLTHVSGSLYFTTYGPSNQRDSEIWSTDGTRENTVFVDRVPYDTTTRSSIAFFGGETLIEIDGTLYFPADDEIHGGELWKIGATDGAPRLVKNIASGPRSSNPQGLTNVDGMLYFTADDGEHGRELWKSDGTERGTQLVIDIREGPAGAIEASESLTNVNGTLYFTADDGTHGRELWKSDGTVEGTQLVKDIREGALTPFDNFEFNLGHVNDTLFFYAEAFVDGQSVGRELWKSDGTNEGTEFVKDINGGEVSSEASFSLFTNLDGTLFFQAYDGNPGHALWKSDGTLEGTQRVWTSNGRQLSDLTIFNASLYFITVDPGRALSFLWSSDGTDEGTEIVAFFQGHGRNLTQVNGTLFFSDGERLWKSDGAESGTHLVRDISEGKRLHQIIENLTTIDDSIYFLASDGIRGQELWSTDGSLPGTMLVKDIVEGPEDPFISELTNVAGTLYFVADDAQHGRELLRLEFKPKDTLSDLVVKPESVMVLPESPVFSESMSVSWQVSNEGVVSTEGSWSERIYLSNNSILDAGDTLLATHERAEGFVLTSGETALGQVEVQLPLDEHHPNGSYYIIVWIDVHNHVCEADEFNNVGLSNPVRIVAPFPDLIVNDIVAPIGALSGQEVPISWTIANQGGADAAAFTDRIYLSSDTQASNDDVWFDFPFAGTLGAGESTKLLRTQNIRVPDAREGMQYVIIYTDVGHHVDEGPAGETNNITVDEQPITVLLRPSPSLVVKKDGFEVPSENVVFAGQKIEVAWRVLNSGDGPTDAVVWYDQAWLSADDTLDTNFDTLLGEIKNASFLDVGQEYRNTLTATLDEEIAEGLYHLIVVTDYRRHVLELGDGAEDDNQEFSNATITVRRPPPPDLQVTQVQVAPTSVFSGNTLSVSWLVENNDQNRDGAATRAGGWVDEVYLVDNETKVRTFLGRLPHSGDLEAGESYAQPAALTVTIPLATISTSDTKSYSIVVVTDATDAVNEQAFELNNDTQQAPLVVTQPLVADLGVTGITVDPAQPVAGHSMAIQFTVINDPGHANPNVPSWLNAFYLSEDDQFDPEQDELLGRRRYVAENLGTPTSESFALRNGIEGNHYVFVEVNSDGAVIELAEDTSNNVNAGNPVEVPIVSAPADLVVSQAAVANTNVKAGQALRLNWQVTNQAPSAQPGGDTIVTRWTDQVYISANATFDMSEAERLASVVYVNQEGGVGQPLQAGAQYQQNDKLVIIPFAYDTGTYYLYVVTDARRNVFEGPLGEMNNVSGPILINVVRDEADLQVTSVIPDQTSALATQPLGISWTVQNSGGPTSAEWWVDDVYLSMNQDATISPGDERLGRITHSNALGRDDSYPATQTFNLRPELEGTFYVKVRTDATRRVVEADEDNNVGVSDTAIVVSLNPVPDLELVSVDAPDTAISGQTFELSWTVRNKDTAADTGARSWDDHVYLSLDQFFDPASDLYLGFVARSGGLAAGEPYTTGPNSFKIPPGRSGPFFVFVHTDGGRVINERGQEANNVRHDSRALQVTLPGRAELVVLEDTITIPADSQPGDPVAINYTVRNDGLRAASGNWHDAVYISSDDQWDPDDPLVGYYFHATALGDVPGEGGTYQGNVSGQLPGATTGTYHVIVRADIRNAIPEEADEFNIGVSNNRFMMMVPELIVGTPHSDSIAFGQHLFYRIEIPNERAGAALVVDFSTVESDVSNELYVSVGDLPSRSQFDFGFSDAFSHRQRVVVPSVQPGSYFVLAVGDPTQAREELIGEYTIAANFVGFTVFNESVDGRPAFGVGGTAGNRTIEIDGAKFDRSVTASLTDGQDFDLPAIEYYRTSDTKLYATFDLTHLNPDTYDVLIEKPTTGESSTIENGLEVVSGGGPNVLFSVNSPEAAARPRVGFRFVDRLPFHFMVSWSNDGLNDAPAPLFILRSNDEFGNSMEDILAGNGTLEKTFLGLGSEGDLGILRPGDNRILHLTTRNSGIALDENEADFHYSFSHPLIDQLEFFDWDTLRERLRPSAGLQSSFENIFNQMRLTVGPLNTDFQRMLSHNASILPQSAGDPSLVEDVVQLELQKAEASLRPSISGTVKAADFDVMLAGETLEATELFTGETTLATVNRDGSFVFSQVDYGNYSLEFSGGVTPGNLQVQVSPAEPRAHVVINAIPGAQLSGYILAADGNEPISGARVVVQKMESPVGEISSSQSDNEGFFQVKHLQDGRYRVLATASGYASRIIDEVSIGRSDKSLQVQMHRGGSIIGTLHDATSGQPLREAQVEVLTALDGRPIAATTSSGKGEFELQDLPVGVVNLRVTATEFTQQVVDGGLGAYHYRDFPGQRVA